MGRHLEHRGLELCETGEQERSVAARPGRALGDQGRLYFPLRRPLHRSQHDFQAPSPCKSDGARCTEERSAGAALSLTAGSAP